MSSNKIILQPDKYQRWQRLQSGAADAMDWSEASFTEPVATASRESDWLVPFAQAVTSGVFAFVAVLLAMRLASLYYVIPGAFWDRLAGAGLLGVTVAWLRWRGLLEDTRSLLRRAETWVNQDLDGDGVVGEPVTIQVDTRGAGGSSSVFSRLPVSEAQLKQFARRALDGRSLGVGGMTGNGQPFSRSEYEDLTAFLDKAGILRWVNPEAKNQGRELTRPGRAAMQKFVN